MNKKVIVIGAGVAGMASAIRLQQAGYDVELFEKEALPGGKMHRVEKDGFKFDLGPTIVMMPELYREIFELCGRDPKADPSMAPEGKEAIYVLLPVSELSAAKYEWNDETIQYYRDYLIREMKKIKGFENLEEEIVSESYTTPVDLKKRFNAYNGATFGLQPTLRQSNHMRPQSKATHCENPYFTGSSTHPGAGVPIVLLSAKIAAQELISDDQGIQFDY